MRAQRMMNSLGRRMALVIAHLQRVAFVATILVLGAIGVSTGSIGAPQQIGWSDLIDHETQDYEDPFRNLSQDNLYELATVARLRDALNDPQLAADAKDTLETRLRKKEKALAKANVDADWLISQRWIVAERRTKAFWAGNPGLDGRAVVIEGFFIPARHIQSGEVVGYVVPEAGMCSHVAPLPPNQLVRLPGLALQDMPQRPYAYVQLTGTLRLDRRSDTSQVIDGPVEMKSAWALQVDEMEEVLQRVQPGATAAAMFQARRLRHQLQTGK